MNAKDKEVLDKIIGGAKSANLGVLYEISGISPEEDNEDCSKLLEGLGKVLDGIEGSTDYIIEKQQEMGNDCDLTILISYSSDFDKMQQLIEDSEKYGLGQYQISDLYVGLLRSPEHRHIAEELFTDGDKCRKSGMRNSYYLTKILCAIKDTNIVDNFINNSDLIEIDRNYPFDSDSDKILFSPRDIAEIVASTGDQEYIGRHFSDEELSSRFGYNTEDLAILAIASKDEAKMREVLNIKYNIYNSEIMIDLLYALNDDQEIAQAIAQPEWYGITVNDVCRIAYERKYPREMLERFPTFSNSPEGKVALSLIVGDENFDDIPLDYTDVEIDLPEDMTIGVEIESLGKYAKAVHYRKKIEGWSAKEDGSIHGNSDEKGVEVVSPILKGDNKETTRNIQKVTGILKAAGERANSSCGGHVHIGANYLTSPQAFYNLEELWANNERILYAISNKEGEKPRDSITSYATPVSGEFEKTLPDTVRINNEDDLESLKKRIAEKQPSRYRSLNFQNLGEGGKGTIEFRLSNGTVDAKTWIENINLYGGLVRAAQEISLIQAKPEEERTEEEAEKLAIFDRLGTDESLQGEERLEYLLKLAIPDPKKREVYRGRYRVNNELINDDYSLTERFDNDVSKKLVRYSDKKAIGKEIFTGENAVNGEMMEDVGEFISNDQQQLNIDQTHSTDDDIK